MTLRKAVTDILSRQVTEEEAKKFALEQYGVLCAYIRYDESRHEVRNLLIDKVKGELKHSKKNKNRCMSTEVEKEYETWLKSCENSKSESICQVEILYESKTALKEEKPRNKPRPKNNDMDYYMKLSMPSLKSHADH